MTAYKGVPFENELLIKHQALREVPSELNSFENEGLLRKVVYMVLEVVCERLDASLQDALPRIARRLQGRLLRE